MIEVSFHGVVFHAMPSGTLWWPDRETLVVSDLHFGKAERMARRGGGLLPPYETQDTLMKLQADIDALNPKIVICLGDSFDDLDAVNAMSEEHHLWLARLQAGRDWIWIEGNHDPGPVQIGGRHLFEYHDSGICFRHIAVMGAMGEVSGHYHPKARVNIGGRSVSRACFLWDQDRLIMPAFGTYTGGLRSDDAALVGLMSPTAKAILTGRVCHVIPMQRGPRG